jgi:iron(III) transport system permease protein
LLLAALWLVFSTASEITVVYLFQVPTFAEEIHTIFSAAGAEALAQAVVVSLLPVLVLVPVLLVLLSWSRRGLPITLSLPRQPRLLPLGRWRQPLTLLVGGALGLAFGIPLLALVWKVGLSGTPSHWSALAAGSRLFIIWQTDGLIAGQTLLTAAGTGFLTATAALLLAWALLDHHWLRLPVACLLLLLWVLPGPVIGLGLKEVIQWLVLRIREPALSWVLYDGPSPVPVMWAHGLRALPLAAGILWVGLRQVPRELREAAAVEGAGPLRQLVRVIVPVLWPAWLAAAVLVFALALGEISAGKLVETPGWETLSRLIFDRMHYGVAEDVAGLCLLLLGLVGVGGWIFWWVLCRTQPAAAARQPSGVTLSAPG